MRCWEWSGDGDGSLESFIAQGCEFEEDMISACLSVPLHSLMRRIGIVKPLHCWMNEEIPHLEDCWGLCCKKE